MINRGLSIQRIAYFLITLVILTYILIVGKGFFVPICFAMLITFVLKPVAKRVERWSGSRIFAAFVSLLLLILPLICLLVLFGIQIGNLLANAGAIVESLQSGVDDLIAQVGRSFGMGRQETTQLVNGGLADDITSPVSIVFNGVFSSTTVITNLGLTLIYTFFFLLYRTPIKRFILGQFEPEKRDEVIRVMVDVQSVSSKYLYGIGLVMLILGVLNSLGLFLIGIDYAILWGFLAALLAVVPYVGAILGGLIPFVYAFATTDSLYYPLAVIGLFAVIQFIEGNFITPKIVGSSVNINPLFAIMSLLIGASIWGLVGMVVALPLLAITRIILDQIPSMQPIALLLSDDLFNNSEDFLDELDRPQNRIRAMFLLKRRQVTISKEGEDTKAEEITIIEKKTKT